MAYDNSLDRPFGPPLGTVNQPNGRTVMDTTAASRPPLPSTGTVRRIPSLQTISSKSSIPSLHTRSTNSSVSFNTTSSSSTAPSLHPLHVNGLLPDEATQTPIPTGQVIALVEEAMRGALEENGTKGMGNELGGGITIDLSHKNIGVFPEEVVDIIKRELERLALSHNKITTFPTRLAECQLLRYINIRNNAMREFPIAICELPRLEILDISRNKIRILPPELAKLKSLKVLSAQKNRIEELPLSLADMTSLQCIKLEGNPIRFPPREILIPQANSPPNGVELKESELNDVTITTQIKRFLKQEKALQRSEAESGGEESSEGGHTPRPLKRVTSGRFPIKVNGTDVPDLRSPALPRAPPIPSRSHYRGLSQQNAALRRPGIMPLTMGSSNERMRSNSESLLQRDNKIDRSRRMGIVTKKNDLATVDEAKNTNRYSHLRGLSHGSALQNGHAAVNGNSTMPKYSAESSNGRGAYVRRLSSLPERKRESGTPDRVLECAKGIQFAIDLVSPLISSLMDLTKDNTSKRTSNSLERVVHGAAPLLDELDRTIQDYVTYSEEDEEVAPRSNANMHEASLRCVTAYQQVMRTMSQADTVDSLLNNTDAKYVRMLLLSIYGGLCEVHNAGVALTTVAEDGAERMPSVIEGESLNDTLRPAPRDKSHTSSRERPTLVVPPKAIPRIRSNTVFQHPSNLRVMTDSKTIGKVNGRSATMTSATPKSGESFASASSSGIPTAHFTADDLKFNKIYHGLFDSARTAMEVLPAANDHFRHAMAYCVKKGHGDQLKQTWHTLIQRCNIALQKADTLQKRLNSIQLKDPTVRIQTAFWELVNAFMSAYYNMILKVKEIRAMTTALSNDVIGKLRPLQKKLKATGELIQESPWSHILGQSANIAPQLNPQHHLQQYSANHSANSSYAVLSPPPQIALQMTPASAALGPAVQATVPSTPSSATPPNASYNNTMLFHQPYGNLAERASEVLASEQSSAYNSAFSSAISSRAGSRTGTMTGGESFGGGVGQQPMTRGRQADEYGGGPGGRGDGNGTFSPNNGGMNHFPAGSRFGGGGKAQF